MQDQDKGTQGPQTESLAERMCEWCGTPFIPKRRRTARFCSPICNQHAWRCQHPSSAPGERQCSCGAIATNRKGAPRCLACRKERIRLTQQRYHDKNRGSVHRGWDEPTCIWCGKDNEPRSHEVLSPKRFCSDGCRREFWNEQQQLQRREQRVCVDCGNEPTNKFGIALCEPCRVQRKRRVARSIVLRVYGISMADYETLLEQQKGGCAICQTKVPGRQSAVFAVDHCHDSAHVRGLLCYSCNTAVGMLKNDPKIAEAALKYIRRTSQLRLI